MTVKHDEWVIFFEVRLPLNDTLKLHFWNKHIMTSSNGNMFRVTGPICGNPPVTGEFLSQRPMTWNSDVFFHEQTVKQTMETLVIWDAIALIMTSLVI